MRVSPRPLRVTGALAGRHLERLGGWLLVLSGAYIVYYWSLSLAVAPQTAGLWAAPVRVVSHTSFWLARSMGEAPVAWALGAGAVVAGAAVASLGRRGRSEEKVDHGNR
ncbi:MAG: hypothetical protein ACRD02_07785 [Acidimicrobiia bacterium]